MEKLVLGLLALSLVLIGCSKGDSETAKAATTKELFAACGSGEVETVERLLDAGVDVNTNLGTNDRPITPLLVAISEKQFGVAQTLVQRGAALDTRYQGISPYAFALWLQDGNSTLVRQMEKR